MENVRHGPAKQVLTAGHWSALYQMLTARTKKRGRSRVFHLPI